MNGSAVLVVVALIAMSGLSVSGAAVGQEKVEAGPTTYTTEKRFPGEVSVYKNNNVATTRNLLPARTFTLGSLTENSLVVSSINVNVDGPGFLIVGNIGFLNQSYTFIETFDTSYDGQSGGFVELVSGGIGSDEFVLAVVPSSPNRAVQLSIASYGVDGVNGGRNFRFGRYHPGLELLSWSYFNRFRHPTWINTLTYDTFVIGEIDYMQSRDSVVAGTGNVLVTGGGIGSPFLEVSLVSGTQEEVIRTVEIFGNRA